MQRRQFLIGSSVMLIAGTALAHEPTSRAITPTRFNEMRRHATTPFGNIAYVERGDGPVALFLHGYPLNGFQWRGALERLSDLRRCIAPDFMGLGHTEVPIDQDLSPQAQATMLVALLDALSIGSVDLVANDSGGTVAQLLVAQHPARVRTLLLTNCDVHENSPPVALRPVLEQARAGVLADAFLMPQFVDKASARSAAGLGGLTFTNPSNLTDENIDCYFAPLLTSQKRKAQFNAYAVAFDPNPLIEIEPLLRASAVPVRVVWGTGDFLFPTHWADWLDQAFMNSRGVRRIEGAKLFFPEEMPELIAKECRRLWSADTSNGLAHSSPERQQV